MISMTKKPMSVKKLALHRESIHILSLDSGQTSDAVTCTCLG
jgi:hypothetical protein